MKFFFPMATSPKLAEQLYEDTKNVVTVRWPIGPKRIRSITFRDRGKTVVATVGELDPCEGRMVYAIFDTYSHPYLVCVPGRGGLPILVGKNEVTHVEEFEPETDAPK